MNLNLSLVFGSACELFPYLNCSYYLPSIRNREVAEAVYHRRGGAVLRIGLLLFIWLNVLGVLMKKSLVETTAIATLLFFAFYSRIQGSSHDQVMGQEAIYWYVAALIGIYYSLTDHFQHHDRELLKGIGGLIGGHLLIRRGRNRDLAIDLAGRVVYTAGFYFFIRRLRELK